MGEIDGLVSGRLEILNGGFEGMTYALSDQEIVIGRNPTTDITLLDEGISREHALVLFAPPTASRPGERRERSTLSENPC